MNSKKIPTRIVAGSEIDLVGIIPYLLGIRPTESLVVVGVDDQKVGVVARMDLDVAAADLAAAQARLAQLDRPGRRFVAMAYTADPGGDACGAVMGALKTLGDDRVGSIILVNGNRAEINGDGVWRDVPESFQPAVEAGLPAPLPSRAALVAAVAGPGPGLAALAEQWWNSAQEQNLGRGDKTNLAEKLMKIGLRSSSLSGRACADLAWLVQDEAVCGSVLLSITAENAQQQAALWRQVVNQVPDEAAPPALGLLAVSAWVAGQSVLQTCAIERGLDIDPDHPLVNLAYKINQAALPPDQWKTLRDTIMGNSGDFTDASLAHTLGSFSSVPEHFVENGTVGTGPSPAGAEPAGPDIVDADQPEPGSGAAERVAAAAAAVTGWIDGEQAARHDATGQQNLAALRLRHTAGGLVDACDQAGLGGAVDETIQASLGPVGADRLDFLRRITENQQACHPPEPAADFPGEHIHVINIDIPQPPKP